jgi:serine/threonine protein kinase
LADFKLLGTLGSGTFSKVKLGEIGGLYYAVKIFDKKNNKLVNEDTLLQTFDTELNVFNGVDHANIIKMHGFSESEILYKRNGT